MAGRQDSFITTLNGHVFAAPGDGAVRWRAELPGAFDVTEPVSEDAVRYTNPIVASGMVMIAGENGALMCSMRIPARWPSGSMSVVM